MRRLIINWWVDLSVVYTLTRSADGADKQKKNKKKKKKAKDGNPIDREDTSVGALNKNELPKSQEKMWGISWAFVL